MDSIINIYKPEGITSFDVVRKVKKVTNCKKVGHTGTLDPLAVGVLPVCIGKATKCVEFLTNKDKEYVATLKLGVETDTYDREGEILSEKEVNVSQDDVMKAINSFVGEIDQIPPIYSALKVKGKKLYEYAREGKEVEIASRKTVIHYINVNKIELPYVEFTVKCSKGTYIRSLCYDIGKALGCGGAMWALERTESGKFKKEDSIKLEDLTKENVEEHLIPIDFVFSDYEKITVTGKLLSLVLNGVEVQDKRLISEIDKVGTYRVYDENDTFVGIAERDANKFKLVKRFL